MRIITLHSDFIEYEAVKPAIKNAPEADKGKKKVDECLVVFMAAEEGDEEKEAKKTANDIREVAEQVKVKAIVLYPWVHLTSSPAKPDVAMKMIDAVYGSLKDDYAVTKSPFGWYKSFNISVKGHPLSELSREIRGAEGKQDKDTKNAALDSEKKLVSHWYVLDLDGKLHKIEKKGEKIEGFDFSKCPDLKRFSDYEIAKVREVRGEPAHVKIMKEQELVDYEPGSDPGNLRYYPKGRLIKSLLEEVVNDEIIKYGGMEIESPIMYDYEHPSLKKYMNRFPARQYIVKSPNKKLFLRFAACFGQFLMAKDMNISYKQLPLRLYELSKYSFRAEQRGEVSGLRRLRCFSMPDCHAMCRDFEQGKEEMMARFNVAKAIHKRIGFDVPGDFELGLRSTKKFYDEHKGHIHRIVKEWGKPALLEMWDDQFFYFVFKYEWNFVDNNDKAGALVTDQFDVENGKMYDITYVDEDGKKKHPIILHFSPSAIERILYAILEREAARMKKGKTPMFPLWLSPTQLRIIPVSEKYLDNAKRMCEGIGGVRVDIDDSDESLGKKIRRAAMEWVPYVAVMGEKEALSGNMAVSIRATGEKREMEAEELEKMIKKECEGRPFKRLNLPMLLSKRPIFRG